MQSRTRFFSVTRSEASFALASMRLAIFCCTSFSCRVFSAYMKPSNGNIFSQYIHISEGGLYFSVQLQFVSMCDEELLLQRLDLGLGDTQWRLRILCHLLVVLSRPVLLIQLYRYMQPKKACFKASSTTTGSQYDAPSSVGGHYQCSSKRLAS